MEWRFCRMVGRAFPQVEYTLRVSDLKSRQSPKTFGPGSRGAKRRRNAEGRTSAICFPSPATAVKIPAFETRCHNSEIC
jgi:hypothetical protein